MKTRTYLVVFFFLNLCVLYAQTCCSGGIPLSNNIGLAFSDKGTFQVGLNYDYNNLNRLNSGDENLNDNARLRITHSVLLNLGYSITNNLSVEGLLTWVNQRRKITQFGNENLDQTSGIGDAIVLVKYNFPNLIGNNSDIGIGLGTKIPLGSTTETNDLGITLNADLQPGSNAWDIIYWSQFSKSLNFRPSLSISARAIYRTTGTNDSYLGNTTTYKFGNEFQAFLGFSDQFLLLKTVSTPSIDFKYRLAGQDEVGGSQLANTGGKWVSVIPNFAINLTPDLIFSSRAEIPIYAFVEGTQLTPSYRLTFGMLYKIGTKQTIINQI